MTLTSLLMVGVTYGAMTVLERVEGSLLSLNGQNTNAAVSSLLKRGEGVLSQHARLITRDKALAGAVVNQDTAAIDEALTTTFNRISARGDVTDLQIYSASGTFFMPKPPAHGPRQGAWCRPWCNRASTVADGPLT